MIHNKMIMYPRFYLDFDTVQVCDTKRILTDGLLINYPHVKR